MENELEYSKCEFCGTILNMGLIGNIEHIQSHYPKHEHKILTDFDDYQSLNEIRIFFMEIDMPLIGFKGLNLSPPSNIERKIYNPNTIYMLNNENLEDNNIRYDDFDDYQSLCDIFEINESQRKAIHGVDSFYKHAEKLIKENSEKVKELGNHYLINKFKK